MHAYLLVEAIAKFFEAELADLRPLDKTNGERALSVYRFNLPTPAGARMYAAEFEEAADYEGMMPALVVSPISFDDKIIGDREAVFTVSLLAGVYSTEASNTHGPWSVVNILERARLLLQTRRYIDRYELVAPLSWQLFDETTRPLWFGELMTQWRVVEIPQFASPDGDASNWLGDHIIRGDSV